ncbi:MAG TPA: DUF429 domain-containing protein [Acidimicrobiia bacterium]
MPVAGVDGCRSGWVVATGGETFVCRDFGAVVEALPGDAVVAVDMPIGLPDEYVPGGRAADRAARRELPARRSSVFSAPTRRALGASTLAEARARGCPMTIQALDILPKIREVDEVMTPALQARVHEVHPELCFDAMNRGARSLGSKRERAGRTARRALLRRLGIVVPARVTGASEDDVLDAGAALWGARRLATGTGRRVPEPPPVDRRGLRMEICW